MNKFAKGGKKSPKNKLRRNIIIVPDDEEDEGDRIKSNDLSKI